MSFWSHVDALRAVLLRVAAVVLVLGIAAFMATPWLFDNFIMAPCSGGFPTYRLFNYVACASGMPELATSSDFSVDIVSLELSSQLFTHIQLHAGSGLAGSARRISHHSLSALGLCVARPAQP